MRARLVTLHRWLGLTTALFLVLTGLTGSLLAWEHELNAWLAPGLHQAAPPRDGAPMLDGPALRERVARQLGPGVQVLSVALNPSAGETVKLRVAPAPGAAEPGYDEVYANPWTGHVQGTRDSEHYAWTAADVMPFMFKLHAVLALPTPWGQIVMGLVAILWTIDCFVGGWVTLPPRGNPLNPGWWRSWRTAWSIKREAGFYRRNLDLHRAGGLWLWAVLFIFAWSSVMFNLRAQVWQPVMGIAFEFDENWRNAPERPTFDTPPMLGWNEALAHARAEMRRFAEERRLRLDFEQSLAFNPNNHTYVYMVHSNADLRRHVGNTALLIDADTGARLAYYLPTGAAAGDTVGNWMGALHMGHVFGLPYRIFVTVLGLVVVGLSVTGLVVWWKKRLGRLGYRKTQRAMPAAAAGRMVRRHRNVAEG
jgi:uncharacterized iron-regulated membrane protein